MFTISFVVIASFIEDQQINQTLMLIKQVYILMMKLNISKSCQPLAV